MAENKKSFVLYVDLIHTVSKLSDKDAGLLFKHILSYVNDKNPEPKNLIVDVSFEPIKQQLKRDLIKWEEIREKRSFAGKISADKKKQNQQVLTSVNKAQQNSTKSTVSVNDNVTVNVNDTVINKELDWQNFGMRTYGRQLKLPEIEFLENLLKKYSYDEIFNTAKKCVVKSWHSTEMIEKGLENPGIFTNSKNDFDKVYTYPEIVELAHKERASIKDFKEDNFIEFEAKKYRRK